MKEEQMMPMLKVVMQSRKVAGEIRAIMNTKRLGLECARLLNESMLVRTQIFCL